MKLDNNSKACGKRSRILIIVNKTRWHYQTIKFIYSNSDHIHQVGWKVPNKDGRPFVKLTLKFDIHPIILYFARFYTNIITNTERSKNKSYSNLLWNGSVSFIWASMTWFFKYFSDHHQKLICTTKGYTVLILISSSIYQ